MSFMPTAAQWNFLGSSAKYAAIGGGRGTGRSEALLADALRKCRYNSEWHGVFVSPSYPEMSAGPLARLDQTLDRLRIEDTVYKHITNTLHFPNGSTLRFVGLQATAAVDRLSSTAPRQISIDGLNEFTQDEYEMLRRRVHPGLGRIRATCYPPADRSSWIRQYFVDKNARTPGYVAEDYELVKTGGIAERLRDPDYLQALNQLLGPSSRILTPTGAGRISRITIDFK